MMMMIIIIVIIIISPLAASLRRKMVVVVMMDSSVGFFDGFCAPSVVGGVVIVMCVCMSSGHVMVGCS